MADVVTKTKSSEDYNNGGRGVSADRLGNIRVLDPDLNIHIIVQQSGILDTRFDDPTFYSA
jgi:hypothetical protein